MEALDLEEEPAEDGAFYGAPYFVNDAANFVPRSEADAYRGDDDGEERRDDEWLSRRDRGDDAAPRPNRPRDERAAAAIRGDDEEAPARPNRGREGVRPAAPARRARATSRRRRTGTAVSIQWQRRRRARRRGAGGAS